MDIQEIIRQFRQLRKEVGDYVPDTSKIGVLQVRVINPDIDTKYFEYKELIRSIQNDFLEFKNLLSQEEQEYILNFK